MNAFASGGPDSSSFAETANPAFSQSRACLRSLALAAASGTGSSFPAARGHPRRGARGTVAVPSSRATARFESVFSASAHRR